MPPPDPQPESSPPSAPDRAREWRLVPLGVLISTWSAMCGIGGGLFAVPALHYVGGYPLRTAIATSLGLVLATTSAATVTETLLPANALRLDIVLALVAGSLVGAPLGFRIAKRLPTGGLRLVFGALLPVMGVRLFFESEPVVAELGESSVGPLELLLTVVIGVGAGVLAPLLGIAGGLISVPGLYYGIAGLGYQSARACSLAMGVVTSLRSLSLYRQSGLVQLRPAALLGLGGLVGAAIGVRLVHLPAVADVARAMMGVTLCVVGLRFLVDAYRARKRAQPAGSQRA